MRENYTKRLKEEFYPNYKPRCVVDEKVKEAVEKRLGERLPKDYYELINAFGSSSFGDYIKVYSFFGAAGYEDYFDEMSVREGIICDLRRLRGEMGMKDYVYSVENGMIIPLSKFYDIKKPPLDNFDNDVRMKIIKCGDGFPYDIYRNGSGLIYWGCAGYYDLYWNCTEGKFTVVAHEDRGMFYEFDMSCTEFLFDLLRGKMGQIIAVGEDRVYSEYK